MSGYVVWLTGDRGRMDAVAEALKTGLAGTAPSVDVFTAEMVEERLCSVEPQGRDFRDLVIRRMGWLCHLLARNGCAVVAVSASPRREVRDAVRTMLGGHMVEVVVGGRPPDGYEPPHYPEVELAASEGAEVVVGRVRDALLGAGILKESGSVYSAEEETRIKERLEKLGYL